MSLQGLIKLVFLVTWCSVAVSQQAIECPFPEGQEVASEEECSKYNACEWTDGICHMKDNQIAGYVVIGDPVDTGRGLKYTLQKADQSFTMFGDDIEHLFLEIIHHEEYHLQIKIYDANADRYEVPVSLSLPEEPSQNHLYDVVVSGDGEPLDIQVVRLNTSRVLFHTHGPLTFENQFIQFTTTTASTYLYGFGENTHLSFRQVFEPRTTFPMFARDQAIKTEQMNVYGHHPYYMVMEDDEGNSHSVLLFNSNAMEYSTFLLDESTPALTMRTIGGIIDLHIFMGPYPEDINLQYTNMVGIPAFPPYWALGFQLSRFGYNSTNAIRETRERMKVMGIPQDVQHMDIDYMEHRRDFTFDPEHWADLPDLINELHADNVKVSLILDPGIANEFEEYPPAVRGKESDVFIKWSDEKYIPPDQKSCCENYMVGNVWAENQTVFPDFLKEETHAWWQNEIHLFHEVLDFDGFWIDMNEPSNFGTNLGDGMLTCPDNHLDSPPYPTMMVRVGDSLSKRISDHTICMSGNQSDGTYLHYDVHSLYGRSQAEATFNALEALFPEKRPVILSRSTFPGSGKYSFHWLGDNGADWDHMRMSIIGMLDFNMFGIPMVGADICGFFDEPSMEMCARWMELGAFYPFSRNHNTMGTPGQDPAVWPEVAEISREILLLRYKYLPYLYSLFHRAHMHGNSVVRPLLNVFPNDITGRDVDDQFMWGTMLMIAPVLEEGASSRDVYFPEGLWYDLKSGVLASSGSATQTVNAPLSVIPVYIRGGSIMPWQEPSITTQESRSNPFGLTIALDNDGNAQGEIYWDDGEEEHVMSEAFMNFLTFEKNELSTQIKYDPAAVKGLVLETVSFYGFQSNPIDISINGTSIASSDWKFDAELSVLEVTVAIPLDEDFSLTITN